MKCIDPVLCYTSAKGLRAFRHFSLANPIFKRSHQQVFDCGKCIHCRKKRAIELASRCVLHSSLYPNNCFLTLTYDEKQKDYHNVFQYRDIQLFKKNSDQEFTEKQKTELKYLTSMNMEEMAKNIGTLLSLIGRQQTEKFYFTLTDYRYLHQNPYKGYGHMDSQQSETFLKHLQCTNLNIWKKILKIRTQLQKKNLTQNTPE